MIADPIPETIGRYRVIDEIGKGGQSVVYVAHDDIHQRRVAIKVFKDLDGLDGRRMIEKEIQALGPFDSHSNIVTVHDSGVHGTSPYLVMTFYEERSLRDRLKNGVLSVRETLDCARDLASALVALHSEKPPLVHRDIKPLNVFMSAGKYVLGDFGISTFAVAGAERTTSARLGTWEYASPELLQRGLATPASDIFALGTTLYVGMTGRLPFEGPYAADELTTPAPIGRDDVPVELESLVARLLAGQPAARPTARTLLEEIEVLRSGSTLDRSQLAVAALRPAANASVVHEPTRLVDRPRRLGLVAAVAGAIGVVGVIGAATGRLVSSGGDGPEDTSFRTPVADDIGAGFLAAPEGLTIDQDAGGIRATWQPVDGAERYRVRSVDGDALGDVAAPETVLLLGEVPDGTCVVVEARGADSVLSLPSSPACLGG